MPLRSPPCGRIRPVGLLLLVWLLAPAGGTAAQEPATVRGQVVDDATEQALAGATVRLIASWGQRLPAVATDGAGRFTLHARLGGFYRIRASRIGLEEALSAPIQLEPGDTVHVVLRMNVQAVELPALEVVAHSRARRVARIEGFHYRAQRGFGGFIHREEIERRNPAYLADMLQEHGIDVERSGRGLETLLWSRRFSCAPLVYVNGALAVPWFLGRAHTYAAAEAGRTVNEIHPADVIGVEIYRGGATVPAEFGGSDARCGVIVIWTGYGGNAEEGL